MATYDGQERQAPEREEEFYFGPFRLEVGAKQVWRGTKKLALRPLPVRVLLYMLRHPERVVEAEELLQQLWAGTRVSRTVVRVCIREIRRALGDEAGIPHYLETVGKQGYRFIGTISNRQHVADVPRVAEARESWHRTPYFVGREEDLAKLHGVMTTALAGQRQLVFVTGEAGVGKTAVVERFLARPQLPDVWLGWGQCIEHYGAGEAYLPVLEALGRLGREDNHERLVAVLRRVAPSWLVQLPALVEEGELEGLQRAVQGVVRERMLREFADALEVLTAEQPVVLVLEDLHWSDVSTVELLAFLARRREPARLLILGTYRPVAAITRQHPLPGLVRELRVHEQCTERRLELLTPDDVQEYLCQRLQAAELPVGLREVVYRRTEGNALFMVTFVDFLLERGLLAQVNGQWGLTWSLAALEASVPESLQELLLQQVEALEAEEQRVLEVASVEGVQFTTAAVAAGLGSEQPQVERVCQRIAQRGQLLQMKLAEEWPDGTFTTRYEFRHALYQSVLYERQGEVQRVRVHRLVGERAEAGYGEQTREVAAELAVHFAQAREYGKAVQYHGQAGENALRRSAYREASDHCQKGLALLKRLPDTSERQQQELGLRMNLSTALTVTQGFMAEELMENLTRARELCHLLNDDASLVSVLVGPSLSYYARADREAVEQMMGEERRLLGRIQEPKLALQLHTVLGTSSMVCGALRQALEHDARVLELYNPQWHQELVLRFGLDPAVMAEIITGFSLWLAGWPDQARTRVQHGCRRARELDHRYSLAFALTNAARVHLWCGEINEAERLAEDGVSVAREGGVWFMRLGSILLACSRVQCGEPEAAISLLTELIAQYRNIEVIYLLPQNLSALADAYGQVGRVEEGLATIAEAVHITETRATAFWAAEVYRLKGDLTLAQSRVQSLGSKFKKSPKSKVQGLKSATPKSQEEAEVCFLKAIEIARQQEAKSLELRAVMSLVLLRQRQAQEHATRNPQHSSHSTQHESRRLLNEAHQMLSEIYLWFTEGFDTKDLQEAKELLAALRV